MGRKGLEPGESGRVTVRGKHPTTGLWRSEASLKAERVRPRRWRGEVRYHDPERHKVRVLTAEGDTKAEAISAIKSALRQAKEAEGLHPGAGDITVGRAVRGYMRMILDGDTHLSPRSATNYVSACRYHFLADRCEIRDIPLRHLTALQIEADMARVVRDGAPSQLGHYRAILNTVLKRAVKARAIEENPMRRVDVPVVKRKPVVYAGGRTHRLNRALTEEEDRHLLAALREPSITNDLALVIRWQGLRISEAASLRIEDVDLEQNTITIDGKLSHVKGEGFVWDETVKSDLSRRTLPIREGARKPLERRRTAAIESGVSEYLFARPGSSTANPNHSGKLLRALFDRVGLTDVTAHTLRRTVERELEIAGATVSERETFMGHTERVARKHYADHGSVRHSIIIAMDSRGVEVE